MAGDFFIPINSNIELFCRIIGEGEPVVLLHGYGQSQQVFKKWESLLSEKFKVILIDSRNHGNSTRSLQISIPLMAKDIYEAMKWLNIGAAKFIGFSDGGNIALQLAVDYKEIVKKIVVISGNATASGLSAASTFAFNLYNNAGKVFAAKDLSTRKLLVDQPNISQDGLNAITAQALLIFGDRDIITRKHIRYLNENISGSKVIIVKNTTHFNILEKYSDYIQEIMDFL